MTAKYKPIYVEPARRHRCEACKEVFECHLCTIAGVHMLHSDRRTSRDLFYVCEECARTVLPTVTTFSSTQALRTYDYLTGEVTKTHPAAQAQTRWMERQKQKGKA